MSVIDTGLGWKCDSDYFVAEADAELAIVSTDTAYKALQGSAITAQITNGNSTQLFLISTVENNAKLKMNTSLRTVYSVSVSGETWYISMSYMSGLVTSDYPLITASKGETLNDTTTENLAKIIAEITEAAEVVFAKKIPTVDYIHQYVEGVESETATRVNAVKNMITPVFNDQIIYAVGDYCIYNNGLYKCTNAHTGAWSANDFTSVSVMDEVKNASGGGGGRLPETTKIVTFDRQVDDFTQATIVKSVTFPVLGDSGCGEFGISGVIQYGDYSANLGFVGRSPMYRMYTTPYTKYLLVNQTPSQSGSYPTISPCFGCSSGTSGFSATFNNQVYMNIVLDNENFGVVNVTLYTANIGSYKINRVSVTITVIFA